MFERASNQNAAAGKFADKSRNVYTDSFLNIQQAVLNTPIVLIDPETNHNGIELLQCNIAEYNSLAVPVLFVVLANNHLPQTVYDGDFILAPNQISAGANGASLTATIYIEPNKGIYFFPLIVSTAGIRQGLFRRF